MRKYRWKKPSRAVLVVGGAAVTLVLLFVLLTKVFHISVPSALVRTAFVPVQSFFTDTIQNTRQYFENMSYQLELETQYVQLLEENGRLRSELLGQEEVLRENERLSKLLGWAQEHPEYRQVLGKVVAMGPDNWYTTFTIDIGSKDGVTKDAPVLNADGVIDRVLEVNDRQSVVLTLADGRSAVGAMLERTRDNGILYGNLSLSEQDETCTLRRLLAEAECQPGDRLLTNGLDNFYPKGLLLGTVSSVSREADGERYAVVRPVVNLANVEEVLVLLAVEGATPAVEATP